VNGGAARGESAVMMVLRLPRAPSRIDCPDGEDPN
jgi:hypothetical protein